MLVCCLGDVMLDVVVEAATGLAPDDDTPARITLSAGGQAANVAAWVTALGARARVFGPRSDSPSGRLVAAALTATGIEAHGADTTRPGAVMSLVSEGGRSLASDPGSLEWLEHVSQAGGWLDGADWLYVSGYALLRSPHPDQIVGLAETVRAAGGRVAVDLSSAAMIKEYGAARFGRLWQALRPSVVFANDDEWTATNRELHGSVSTYGAGGTSVLVLKHGPRGATFVIDGVEDARPAPQGEVRDPTGSGDALSAGYLVGGVDLAMTTAARCVAQVGAAPRSLPKTETER